MIVNPEHNEEKMNQYQDLVTRSAYILNQTNVIQQLIEKFAKQLKANTVDIETSTKAMIKNLQLKLATLDHKDENSSAQQMQEFCDEAFSSINECTNVLVTYENLLNELS